MSSRLGGILLLVVILICGCAKDPFSVRDNEAPTTKPGTFVPPTAPVIVLENLRLSYAELVIGNYIQCLDSHFVFKFDYIQITPGDTAWSYTREVTLTQKMFNEFNANKATRRMSVQFNVLLDQPDAVLDTSATLVRSYTLLITDTLGTVQEDFHGIARFELIESSFNFWTLRRWEDLHGESQTNSWAEFKNAYR